MTINNRMVVIDFISCILLASLELNSEQIQKIFSPHMTYNDQPELHIQEWFGADMPEELEARTSPLIRR